MSAIPKSAPHGLRSVREILSTPPTYPIAHVEIDGRHIVIYDVQANGERVEMYDIPVERIQDAPDVAFWFRQIALKSWVTKDHLYKLACVVHALHSGT